MEVILKKTFSKLGTEGDIVNVGSILVQYDVSGSEDTSISPNQALRVVTW